MLSPKENFMKFYKKEKIEYLPRFGEGEYTVYPVNGFYERPAFEKAGEDWFGCSWEISGAVSAPAPDLSKPPLLEDICDWKAVVKFPDLDNFDWENAKKIDKVDEIDRENNVVNVVVLNGIFERLHLLMGFENALCTFLTDPEDVGEFLDAMADYKCRLIEKLAEYYKPDIITYHDDWGTQRGMFFSKEIWRQFLKERTKKIVNKAHDLGIMFELHCCGKIDAVIPEIAEIGVDVLQCMDINDIDAALKKTGNNMNYIVSMHSQEFEVEDSVGKLTPQYVHEIIRKDIMTFGASGRYFPLIFPDDKWYTKIVFEEFDNCQKKIQFNQ